MKEYYSKWTFVRLIQLSVGCYFLYQYILGKDVLMLFFGSLMLLQAIFNIGCFSSKGCSISNYSKKEPFSSDIDVIFEEVK